MLDFERVFGVRKLKDKAFSEKYILNIRVVFKRCRAKYMIEVKMQF